MEWNISKTLDDCTFNPGLKKAQSDDEIAFT